MRSPDRVGWPLSFVIIINHPQRSNTMSQKFQVTGMSCGHCVNAVQNAVQTVDPEAQVTVDLETGHVDVLSEQPRKDIVAAIENAGYAVQ